MKTVKQIFASFLLVISSLLFALLVIEFAVRSLDLYSFPSDDFIEPHQELGWTHIANKEGYWTVGEQRIPVKINSKGLRDVEYAYEKEKGTFRILVLGDSFTEAFQVTLEDTFCKVLERELNKQRRHFEVINGGFSGVGTDYEMLFLRQEGHKYHPDLVIVAFFPNDVSDNYKSKSVLENRECALAYEKKGLVVQLKHFLSEKSCAYNYLGYTLPKHVPLLANLLMKIGLLSFRPIDNVQGVDQLHYLVFAKEYGPEWEKAWDVTQILVSKLKQEVENNSSRIAVISIPFMEQVYESLWKSKISKPGMGDMEWDIDKPDRLLSVILNKAGVPFLPLVSYFREAAETTELYHRGDGHWNVDGHHLAGLVIYNWLIEEKLVPLEAHS